MTRWLYFISFFFLLWANLHGTFGFGLVVLSVYLAVKFFTTRKLYLKEILVFITSILATLITPYGIKLWQAVFMQSIDPLTRQAIAEWQPLFGTSLTDFLNVNLAFIILALISVPTILFYFKKLNPSLVLFYLITLFAAFYSRRHLPLWLIVALPLTTQTLDLFYQDHIKKRLPVKPRKIIVSCLALFVVGVFIWEKNKGFQNMVNSTEAFAFPQNSLSYLKIHKPKGHILSSYNWGGYLIWKLPEQKVFIDGRMPSWRWQAPNSNESNWAFKDYIKMVDQQIGTKQIIDKYQITTVVWPAQNLKNTYKVQQLDTELNSKYTTENKFINQLLNLGFIPVYLDKITLILQRPN